MPILTVQCNLITLFVINGKVIGFISTGPDYTFAVLKSSTHVFGLFLFEKSHSFLVAKSDVTP